MNREAALVKIFNKFPAPIHHLSLITMMMMAEEHPDLCADAPIAHFCWVSRSETDEGSRRYYAAADRLETWLRDRLNHTRGRSGGWSM